MADDSDPGADAEEQDLGAPIDELRGYEEPVDGDLLGRVVRSLRRRSLGSHLATLSWSALGHVLRVFLEMIYSLFGSPKSDRGESD